MTYKNNASTMTLTRNCLALAQSEAVQPISLLKSKITYVNGNQSICDLCSGTIRHKSRYRDLQTHNSVNKDPKAYEITPVYFSNPDNPNSRESLYRHGKVHVINTFLSAYHRELFDSALCRAVIQDDCDLSEAIVDIHHIDGNKRNNAIYNLLPVTNKEHHKIHKALRRGASTYVSLVAGLGVDLVHSIFGVDYFDCDDGGGVYTAARDGIPYIQRILTQLSTANLPSDTTYLRVKLLNGKYDNVDIVGKNVYQILSALYIARADVIVTRYKI